jgi:hypothetical protein
MDISRLNRSAEYWEALEKRLGFTVTDGKAVLVHCAGVSFENRQELLQKVRSLCNFEFSPPLQLVPEPGNPYDVHAVQVLVGISRDELTGDYTYAQVGFLPKKHCPGCSKSLSGKQSKAMICPDCETPVGIAPFNKKVADLLNNSSNLEAGIDNVTVPQHVQGNMGLDIWIRGMDGDGEQSG